MSQENAVESSLIFTTLGSCFLSIDIWSQVGCNFAAKQEPIGSKQSRGRTHIGSGNVGHMPL